MRFNIFASTFAIAAVCFGAPFKAIANDSNFPLEEAEKLDNLEEVKNSGEEVNGSDDSQPVNPRLIDEAGETIKVKPISSFGAGGGVTTSGNPSWHLGARHSVVGVEFGGVVKDAVFEDSTGNNDSELSFKADIGGDLLFFLDLDDQYLSIYGGAGVYGLDYNTKTEEYEDATLTGTVDLRLSPARNFALGLSYHTVRGINGSLVYRF